MLGTLAGGPLFHLLPEVNLANVFLINSISAFTSCNAFFKSQATDFSGFNLLLKNNSHMIRKLPQQLLEKNYIYNIIFLFGFLVRLQGQQQTEATVSFAILSQSLQSTLSTSSFIKAFLFRLERRLLAQQRAKKREFTQLGAFI